MTFVPSASSAASAGHAGLAAFDAQSTFAAVAQVCRPIFKKKLSDPVEKIRRKATEKERQEHLITHVLYLG